MAVNHEAIVIVLDVAATMGKVRDGATTLHTPLSSCLTAITLLIHQKLLFNPKDTIGIVLSGTDATKNDLGESGYEHITVFSPIKAPNATLLQELSSITTESAPSDVFSALIVSMDLLKKYQMTQGRKNVQKRIMLMTDGESQLDIADLEVIKNELRGVMHTPLNFIGIGLDDEDVKLSDTKKHNDEFLKTLVTDVGGVAYSVDRALETLSGFRSKTWMVRPIFKGLFEIGDLKIPVSSYTLTKKESFPKAGKVSASSVDSSVRKEEEFVSMSNPDEKIEKHDRVKAWKFGKTTVEFPEEVADDDAATERSLKLIGFTASQNVPRHHLMGHTEMMVSSPDDPSAGPAFFALISALVQTNSVAIVRFVKRAKSAPHFAALFPKIRRQSSQNPIACLYVCDIPFAEDLRQYSFAPLSTQNIRKNFVPSEEQLQAAEKLILSLDLMSAATDDDGNRSESLRPKDTYNPILQNFYLVLNKRAINPDIPLPPFDPKILKYMNPDSDLFEIAQSPIQDFAKKLPLTRTDIAANKKTKRTFQEFMAENEVKLDDYGADSAKKKKLGGDISLEQIISSGVTEVGSINPVPNFQEMLKRRDVDLVDKAIEQMKERIRQLINDSIKDEFYPKAIDCLLALRVGSIEESESDVFNEFLSELKQKFNQSESRRRDFWKLIVSKSITLIDSEECKTSTTSPDEAALFVVEGFEATEEKEKQTENPPENTDDLLDQIE